MKIIDGKPAKLVHHQEGPFLEQAPNGKWQLVKDFKKYAAGDNEYTTYQVLGSGFDNIHSAAQFKQEYERQHKPK